MDKFVSIENVSIYQYIVVSILMLVNVSKVKRNGKLSNSKKSSTSLMMAYALVIKRGSFFCCRKTLFNFWLHQTEVLHMVFGYSRNWNHHMGMPGFLDLHIVESGFHTQINSCCKWE